MNILNLPNFKVQNIEENEHDYLVAAETAPPPFCCPHCGTYKPNLTRFGRKKQLFMDLPIHAKRVGIVVNRQRYRCNECNTTFLEPLEDMDEKRQMTKRLIQYIEKQSLKRTFVSIAEDVGLDEKTIRIIFRDYANRLEETIRIETPKWLGIDEIHIIKPRCVVTNVEQNTIVNILPNRNKDTVIKYLNELPNKDVIQYVAMDMWLPYRDAVGVVLPQAKVIVDKFPVVRMANVALDTVRKSIRACLPANQRRTLMHDRFILLKRRSELSASEFLKLESWVNCYYDLGLAYRLKEEFYSIWDCQSKSEAITKYELWKQQITPSIEDAIKPILTAMENWHTEIFNYFDHPITNAYTERLNSAIRLMYRLGRGYSFEALRAKILFTEGIQKEKRPKYQKQRVFKDELPLGLGKMICESFDDYSAENDNYGTDISTLIKMLEGGEF